MKIKPLAQPCGSSQPRTAGPTTATLVWPCKPDPWPMEGSLRLVEKPRGEGRGAGLQTGPSRPVPASLLPERPGPPREGARAGQAPSLPPRGGVYITLVSASPRLCTGLAGAAVLPSSSSCRPKEQDWGGAHFHLILALAGSCGSRH